MAYKLICVHPFADYVKGQEITDPTEVAKLLEDREQYFRKVWIPDPEPVAAPEPTPAG